MADQQAKQDQGQGTQSQSQGEAARTRGIDSHDAEPGKASRQEIPAPTEQLNRATGNHPDDPENETAAAKTSQKNPSDTKGQGPSNPVKYADKPITAGGQLEADEGVAEQEKDPIE